MAFAFVQSTTVTSDTSPATSAAFGSSTTAGNLIFVTVVGDGGTIPTITSITDSKGNTYTKITDSQIGSAINMVAFYTKITTGGSSHTITATWNDTSENIRVVAQEFSGFTGNPTIDQVVVASGSSTTPASGATGTTARANEIVIGMLAKQGTTASVATAGTGFSNLVVVNDNDNAGQESQIVSSISTYNATFTLSVSRAWLAGIVTFYDSADTGGGGGGGSSAGAFFALL